MKGKNVIITGSTSGIGLGIAKSFAAEGCNIVLNGFGDEGEIEKARAQIAEDHNVNVIYNSADMTKPEEIESLFSDCKEKLGGGVDILVNNAGIQHVAPLEEFPPEKWQSIININLVSAFHTTRIALPQMKEKGWGRIINIGSAHSHVASPYKSAYVAAKHGVLGLTKTAALEVAQQNITVNTIAPGYVKTPLVEGQIKDTAEARGISEEEVIKDVMLGPQATKKFVEINEVGALAVFLCRDEAASITGTSLSVDGGWTAQ